MMRPTPTPRRARPAQRGIVLIEAMVGLLIFSFGVLGLIGLQASMTKAQTGAKFRADAANLTNELLGVMWSDAPANVVNYSSANCTGNPRCVDWLAKVDKQLPAAQTTVAVTAATGQVDITIRWTQPGEGEHRYQLTSAVQP